MLVKYGLIMQERDDRHLFFTQCRERCTGTGFREMAERLLVRPSARTSCTRACLR